MPGHYDDKKKKRAPSARPTKSKGPVMKGVKAAALGGHLDCLKYCREKGCA